RRGGTRAGDGDRPLFERLAQRVQDRWRKLRDLVQKEHSEMREADLSGTRRRPTTNECEMRRGVVGRAERRRRKDWMIWIGEAGDAMDRARRNRFVVVERRQQRRQSAGQHRLAGARRSHKKQVVASSRGDLARALRRLLSGDIEQTDSGCWLRRASRHFG